MNDEVRIQQLSDLLRQVSQERDDALNWNNVLLNMLMENEAKLNGVRAALGDELIQEHPGKQRFRQWMREQESEDDNA